MSPLIRKALAAPGALGEDELRRLLDEADARELFAAARSLKEAFVGRVVYVRGLMEIGNVCAKNCRYCGIRRDNRGVRRYRIPADDVIRMARRAIALGYPALVLQSGEIESEENTARVEKILRAIRDISGGRVGVTLSLGEQAEEVYRRWREAGALRYLLRIETSSPVLYGRLHGPGHSHARRVACLRSLKRLGYHLGTGVMCGLPGQTSADLARDIRFYREVGADMIGMGPWIPHHAAPVGRGVAMTPDMAARQTDLGLRMIAVTRLYLHDVNIAATTALETLDPRGLEKGVMAGANVVMPNATDSAYLRDYALYDDKPCPEDGAAEGRRGLDGRLAAIGEKIAWDTRGDPPCTLKKRR